MKTFIRGGRVVDPSQHIHERKNIFLMDGKVQALLDLDEPAPWVADETIDLNPTDVVAPGLIDLHVHFREPGQTHKEDLLSGSRSAVAGGFTSVFCMPNTFPVNDTVETTRFILTQAQKNDLCRVFPVGALSKHSLGKELAPLEALFKAGCKAFSDDGRPCESTHVFKAAMETCKQLGVPVIEHCEELSVSHGCVTLDEKISDHFEVKGLSPSVESKDVLRTLTLAMQTQAKVHLAHVSCKESVALIQKFKPQLPHLTAEVTPHHLLLSSQAVFEHKANAKMFPPLWQNEDVHLLQHALKTGLIDCVATDHAPHAQEEKNAPLAQTPNGIIGLQTALPVLLYLMHEGFLTLSQVIEVMSVRPAFIGGVQGGTLKVGAVADVVIFNPDETYVFEKEKNYSKSSNTPLGKTKLRGKVLKTFVGGKEKFCVEKNKGQS